MVYNALPRVARARLLARQQYERLQEFFEAKSDATAVDGQRVRVVEVTGYTAGQWGVGSCAPARNSSFRLLV